MKNELLNPRGIIQLDENPIAQRPSTLDKKILGLIDNNKDNADLFLNALHGMISERSQIAEVIKIKKPGPSTPASFPQEFLDKCDCAINAVGD
jgi:hypothetical protein